MKFKDSDENEMIAAFLKAEIDSPRFGSQYQLFLPQTGFTRKLIDKANTNNLKENQARTFLLDAVRGYSSKTYLFTGFPKDIIWKRSKISIRELKLSKYANHPTWTTLTNGSRLVVDGAKNIDKIITSENANSNIKSVSNDLVKGKNFPELIFVTEGLNSELILIEGHTRATAYVIQEKSIKKPIDVFIGISNDLTTWRYF